MNDICFSLLALSVSVVHLLSIARLGLLHQTLQSVLYIAQALRSRQAMTTIQLKSEACEHAELAMDNKNLQLKYEASESCLGLDPEQLRLEKRLVRKLDMTLMPAIWLLYLFNYLDRNNIA